MNSKHFLLFGENNDNFRDFVLKNRYNFDQAVAHFIFALGFRANLCGVSYLREAIKRCYLLSPNAKVSFIKTIYPEIAETFSTKTTSVERNIRTAIQNCYYCGAMSNFNSIAKCAFVSSQYPPTNSEFIMRTVEWFRMELGADIVLDEGCTDLQGEPCNPRSLGGKATIPF